MQTINSRFRFISGFVIASLIFGFSAIAVNVNNTPEGGYLLCANNRTKVVTFPGSLKCPSGTTPIQVPGNGNYISAPEESNPSPKSSPTGTNNNTKGSSKCVLSIIQANPKVISEIIPLCSSEQLKKLDSELKDQTTKIQADIKKAFEVNDFVLYGTLQEKLQNNITILTAIISEIAKRVTG